MSASVLMNASSDLVQMIVPGSCYDVPPLSLFFLPHLHFLPLFLLSLSIEVITAQPLERWESVLRYEPLMDGWHLKAQRGQQLPFMFSVTTIPHLHLLLPSTPSHVSLLFIPSILTSTEQLKCHQRWKWLMSFLPLFPQSVFYIGIVFLMQHQATFQHQVGRSLIFFFYWRRWWRTLQRFCQLRKCFPIGKICLYSFTTCTDDVTVLSNSWVLVQRALWEDFGWTWIFFS